MGGDGVNFSESGTRARVRFSVETREKYDQSVSELYQRYASLSDIQIQAVVFDELVKMLDDPKMGQDAQALIRLGQEAGLLDETMKLVGDGSDVSGLSPAAEEVLSRVVEDFRMR